MGLVKRSVNNGGDSPHKTNFMLRTPGNVNSPKIVDVDSKFIA